MLLRDLPAEQLTLYTAAAATNPVDWHSWGQDAFAEARKRDVPVFLSVGYAACHWCHVMADESFSDPVVARRLNENFVAIKVDREERPDVDSVYMAATTALTGHGGWPMSVWLDHEGRAFYAGTYFPDLPRGNMPSFGQVMTAVSDAWQNRREQLLSSAERINTLLAERDQPAELNSVAPAATIMSAAVTELANSFDPVNAGFGPAPKFPPSMVLRFLLDYANVTEQPRPAQWVAATCTAMARGGMYDQLAGGFARYSVDETWTVPHFEKMLYDNALLVDVYATWWATTGDSLAKRVCAETIEFMLNDLLLPDGGFAAALDADTPESADSPGGEGASYSWSPEQLAAVLGADDGAWVAELASVTAAGTFEAGTSVLQLQSDPDDAERWQRCRQELLAARALRPQPARDDKTVLAWNSLAILALVRAGLLFDREEWISAAVAVGDQIRSVHMTADSAGVRLCRISRRGKPGAAPGLLEDYALTAEAFVALQRATGDTSWFETATAITEVMTALFFEQDQQRWRCYDTAMDAERLVRRPRDPADNATPSGTAAAARALVTVAAVSGRSEWREIADSLLADLSGLMAQHPRFAGWGLQALLLADSGPFEVAVIPGRNEDAAATRELLRTVEAAGSGRAVSVRAPVSSQPADSAADGERSVEGEHIPLLAGRSFAEAAAAHVCQSFACQLPVTDQQALREQLQA